MKYICVVVYVIYIYKPCFLLQQVAQRGFDANSDLACRRNGTISCININVDAEFRAAAVALTVNNALYMYLHLHMFHLNVTP